MAFRQKSKICLKPSWLNAHENCRNYLMRKSIFSFYLTLVYFQRIALKAALLASTKPQLEVKTVPVSTVIPVVTQSGCSSLVFPIHTVTDTSLSVEPRPILAQTEPSTAPVDTHAPSKLDLENASPSVGVNTTQTIPPLTLQEPSLVTAQQALITETSESTISQVSDKIAPSQEVAEPPDEDLSRSRIVTAFSIKLCRKTTSNR